MEAPNSILAEVRNERAKQEQRWGEQNHRNGTGTPDQILLAELAKSLCQERAVNESLSWSDILQEEFSEALAEASPVKLRAELVQVAAVAVAWIECIDRKAAE